MSSNNHSRCFLNRGTTSAECFNGQSRPVESPSVFGSRSVTICQCPPSLGQSHEGATVYSEDDCGTCNEEEIIIHVMQHAQCKQMLNMLMITFKTASGVLCCFPAPQTHFDPAFSHLLVHPSHRDDLVPSLLPQHSHAWVQV